MKSADFIKSNFEYMIETFPGSFINNVVSKQPELQDEIVADLHCHPYISSVKDLYNTIDILVKNNVGLCAITTHGKGDSREFDFWKIKDCIKNGNIAPVIDYVDKGIAFQARSKGRTLTFVPAYEMYVLLDGIEGRIDIISLMPEQGFENVAKEGLKFEDYLKMNHDYGAIVIGAHPYTIWNPYGPKDFFKFRLADDDKRKRIRDNLFSYVDTVDLVSTNCAWMIKSDKLVQEDYPGKPIANSDAHSVNNYCRNEIGRSGNILKLQSCRTGQELREQLKSKITSNNFRTYHNHTPLLQFLQSIAFSRPPKEFP